MFSSEFCEILKNQFFTKHLRKTTSGKFEIYCWSFGNNTHITKIAFITTDVTGHNHILHCVKYRNFA